MEELSLTTMEGQPPNSLIDTNTSEATSNKTTRRYCFKIWIFLHSFYTVFAIVYSIVMYINSDYSTTMALIYSIIIFTGMFLFGAVLIRSMVYYANRMQDKNLQEYRSALEGHLGDYAGPVADFCLSTQTCRIKYLESQILGKGSGRTIVYKGTFGRVEVAVKKILRFQYNREAENEINVLINCIGHPNIVLYYTSEKRFDGYYLALELCQGKTLKDWVTNQDFLPVIINGLDILGQVAKGLEFLHKIRIIHRDLKPSNILFSVVGESVFVKLSDFGISRLLEPGIISKTITSFGGTRGWIAAEMLAGEKLYRDLGRWDAPGMPKLTKKVDIFSLGCLFYFVLTNGQHPFGDDEDLYDFNIKRSILQIKSEQHCLRLRCNLSLIQKMVTLDPNDRPDIQDIQTHPIFWSTQKMISFLVELSNFIFDAPSNSTVSGCVSNLEGNYFHKGIQFVCPLF